MSRQEDVRKESETVRSRYGDFYPHVQSILARHDPVWLIAGLEAPESEYAPEAGRLLLRIEDVHNEEEARQLLQEIFREMFGEGTEYSVEAVNRASREVWNAWLKWKHRHPSVEI